MRRSARQLDKAFFVVTLLLLLLGLLIFTSAALGLLVDQDIRVGWVLGKQILVGVVGGLIGLTITSKIHYTHWKRFAFPIFLLSILVTLLVFVPGVGIKFNEAKRWIDLGIITVQPAEFLKLGTVLYFAAWLSTIKNKVRTIRYGTLPLVVVLAVISLILLAQPNTGLLVIIVLASLTMFWVGGGKTSHIAVLAALAIIGILVLSLFRPYVRDRLETYFTPGAVNPLGEGYQLRQSLIAIGSGEVAGRGFGQSIQKFNYLPEAIGDSIFAVAAEEFGFIGATVIVLFFFFFALFGIRIAIRAPDDFSRYFCIGIVILVVSQSYLNIGAMLGLFPLSGIPVLFISQGGTALFFTLVEVGIMLNISRYT